MSKKSQGRGKMPILRVFPINPNPGRGNPAVAGVDMGSQWLSSACPLDSLRGKPRGLAGIRKEVTSMKKVTSAKIAFLVSSRKKLLKPIFLGGFTYRRGCVNGALKVGGEVIPSLFPARTL